MSDEKHIIEPGIFTKIQTCLKEIERKNNVRVLYACESGSRAWGFESQDSDYDVRFIYVRPRDWYISIDVERAAEMSSKFRSTNDLDINGWDIRKTLQLFQKSNPPLNEWLLSPVVYATHGSLVDRLRELAPATYNPVSARYHYLSMAKKTYKNELTGYSVRRKKYLYALRPLLAVEWIETGMGVVPIEFEQLVAGTIVDQPLLGEINQLLDVKRSGNEADTGPRFELIQKFIEAKLEQYADTHSLETGSRSELTMLNNLFRETIERDAPSDRHVSRSPN